ncbi:MarR family winged helix-turn-helix transcriptional regulator [Pedobacter insulae]|uniref:DNA-binding transcriptional regulator, MarR family n=1 Tax=Pedobacter insulae TaxID=414048 RepID=A0A1I2ZQH7_9SPHI|nr:MarR family transcriptional regulator [Pedobacter insulae]SFH40132.1 DNA-binding transcriptional regulator, MarR family [Pedobacter insulae]
MDLVNELAELAIATRLKRLSERLSNDVSKIYKESDVDFEARWFLILSILEKEKLLAITEIADYLQLSHPAIIQLVQELEKKKLIKASVDKKDGRKRMVSLTAMGKKTLAQIEPVLRSIKAENKKWIDSASANILDILTELEQSLTDQSMYHRIKLNILQQKPGSC